MQQVSHSDLVIVGAGPHGIYISSIFSSSFLHLLFIFIHFLFIFYTFIDLLLIFYSGLAMALRWVQGTSPPPLYSFISFPFFLTSSLPPPDLLFVLLVLSRFHSSSSSTFHIFLLFLQVQLETSQITSTLSNLSKSLLLPSPPFPSLSPYPLHPPLLSPYPPSYD